MKRKIFVFLSAFVFLTGLTTVALAGDKSIADLEANPSKYENKTITIKGIVRDSDGLNVPILGIRGGCYKIDDGSGSIWVCTDQSVPTKGAELKVKGKLQSGGVVRGKNYGLFIFEEKRKFRKK